MSEGPSTRLVRELRRLEERIERELRNGRARPSLRRRAQLELLGVLNGTRRFDLIPKIIPNTQTLTTEIYKRVNGTSGYALPRAIYESACYDRSIESMVARRQIHASEWAYVSRLAKSLNVEPSHGQGVLDEPPAWMIDVDESHQSMRVWIREPALQDMIVAGMEAYIVPAGSGKPSTEIYGIAFGSFREAQTGRGGKARRASLIDYNIERVCIQHRAKGSPSEVVVDWRSEAAQLALAEELFPYWRLLGDFHTHTYRSLAELLRVRGWRFSTHDQRENIAWCERLREIGQRPRLALIMAITRAARQRLGTQECWDGLPNVVRTVVGRCHCFIAAYRIRPDGRYSSGEITLKCPHLSGH